ncbi:MAG: pyridoxal-phosphate dependent enzyme [Trueperaceae bacterium]
MPTLTKHQLLDLIDDVPQLPLASLPTPLENCPNLSHVLGGPPIWIKRDDCTGLATGGNKTRYLEFVLADAKKKGADTIVVSSGNQSNQCRQVAAAAAKLGLESVLLLWGAEPEALEGNLLLSNVLGAQIVFLDLPVPNTGQETVLEPQFALEAPPGDRSLLNDAIDTQLTRLRKEGRVPYCINTDPRPGLAALGYVKAAVELIEQLDRQGIPEADVFVASGGATHAGLLLGSLLLSERIQVHGVYYQGHSVDSRAQRIAGIAEDAARLLNLDLQVDPSKVDSDPTFATRTLFDNSVSRWQTVLDVARTEGILIEPSYTGRALMAVERFIAQGRYSVDRPIVLVHTGGTPLLFPLGRQLIAVASRRMGA